MDHKHSAHRSSGLEPSDVAMVHGGAAYVCPMHPEVRRDQPLSPAHWPACRRGSSCFPLTAKSVQSIEQA